MNLASSRHLLKAANCEPLAFPPPTQRPATSLPGRCTTACSNVYPNLLYVNSTSFWVRFPRVSRERERERERDARPASKRSPAGVSSVKGAQKTCVGVAPHTTVPGAPLPYIHSLISLGVSENLKKMMFTRNCLKRNLVCVKPGSARWRGQKDNQKCTHASLSHRQQRQQIQRNRAGALG